MTDYDGLCEPETDFSRQDHRCMPWARNDGSSVLFKRLPHNG